MKILRLEWWKSALGISVASQLNQHALIGSDTRENSTEKKIEYFSPDLVPDCSPLDQSDIEARFEHVAQAKSAAAPLLIGMQEQKELSHVLNAATNVVLQAKFDALSERRASSGDKTWDEEAVDFFEFCIKSHAYYSTMLSTMAFYQKGFIDLVEKTATKLEELPEDSLDAMPVQLELEGYQDRVTDFSHTIEILRRRFRLLEQLTEIYDKKVKLQINATRLATLTAIDHNTDFESAALGRALDDIHPERVEERKRLENERRAQANMEAARYLFGIGEALAKIQADKEGRKFIFDEPRADWADCSISISFWTPELKNTAYVYLDNETISTHKYIHIDVRDDGYSSLRTQKHIDDCYNLPTPCDPGSGSSYEPSPEQIRRSQDSHFKNKGKFSGRNKEQIIEYILEWAKDSAPHLVDEINQAMDDLVKQLDGTEQKDTIKALPAPTEQPLALEITGLELQTIEA